MSLKGAKYFIYQLVIINLWGHGRIFRDNVELDLCVFRSWFSSWNTFWSFAHWKFGLLTGFTWVEILQIWPLFSTSRLLEWPSDELLSYLTSLSVGAISMKYSHVGNIARQLWKYIIRPHKPENMVTSYLLNDYVSKLSINGFWIVLSIIGLAILANN